MFQNCAMEGNLEKEIKSDFFSLFFKVSYKNQFLTSNLIMNQQIITFPSFDITL